MGVFDKIVETMGKVVAPDDATAADLKVKKANIDEYTRATTGTLGTPSAPVVPAPASVDKVRRSSKFGSRSGEKRIDTTGMTSYKKGTVRVPKTGPYMLHEGEAVIPAKDNPMNPYDKVTEGGKKPKKILQEIRTRKAKTGGYIHEHHHTESVHHKMEEHTTPDMKGMLAHMSGHMGPEPEGANENEQSAAEAQEKAVGME